MTKRKVGLPPRGRELWDPIHVKAREIVESYGNAPPSLREVFYKLVALQMLENKLTKYNQLSTHIKDWRKYDDFPDLVDTRRNTVGIPAENRTPEETLRSALNRSGLFYSHDHSEGQPVTILVGVEKQGLLATAQSATKGKDIPILPLGGYPSYSYRKVIAAEVAYLRERYDRPVHVLYLGDMDPSGEDIEYGLEELPREFWMEPWDSFTRVAITDDQVAEYGLPENPGKTSEDGNPSDPRAKTFMARHGGRNYQVEVDALDRDILIGLLEDAIDDLWDYGAEQRVIDAEERDAAITEGWAAELDAFLTTLIERDAGPEHD